MGLFLSNIIWNLSCFGPVGRIFLKNVLENKTKKNIFKKWIKNIKTAGYNSVRTVVLFHKLSIFWNFNTVLSMLCIALIYHMCATITCSWFETALKYKPRILDPKIEEFPCLVHKLSVTLTALQYKPQWKIG